MGYTLTKSIKVIFIVSNLLLPAVLSIPVLAYTIQLPSPGDSQLITSVLNEPRGAGNPGTRFHNGVDIEPFDSHSEDPNPSPDVVYAIEGGAVQEVGGTGINRGVQVGDRFVYIHADLYPGLESGMIISAGDPVAIIIDFPNASGNFGSSAGDHLHLTERAGFQKRLNPLRPGELTHTDLEAPQFEESTGVGTDTSISLVADREISPLPRAANGEVVVPDFVDILVSVTDQPSRKGIYAIDFSVQDKSAASVFEAPANIVFDEKISDAFIGSSSPANRVYLRENASSFVMWATHRVAVNPSDVEAGVVDDRWDTRSHSEGEYTARVQIRDRNGNSQSVVERVIIDRTSPEMIVRDAPGAIIANAQAVNTPTIKVAASDPAPTESVPSGIDKIVLTQVFGGNYSSTTTFNGEQAVNATIAGPNGNPLPEGIYAVSVYDLAALHATQSFSIDQPTAIKLFDRVVSTPNLTLLTNTISLAPWHRDNDQKYILSGIGFTTHTFTLTDPLGNLKIDQPLPPETFRAETEAVGLEDGKNYHARLAAEEPLLDYFFHLDSTAPLVQFTAEVSKSGSSLIYRINGTASDEVSGLQYVNLASGTLGMTQGGGTLVLHGDPATGPFLDQYPVTSSAASTAFSFSPLDETQVATLGAGDVAGNRSMPLMSVAPELSTLTADLIVTEVPNPVPEDQPFFVSPQTFRLEALGIAAQRINSVTVSVVRATDTQVRGLDVYLRGDAGQNNGPLIVDVPERGLTKIGTILPGGIGQVVTQSFTISDPLFGTPEIYISSSTAAPLPPPGDGRSTTTVSLVDLQANMTLIRYLFTGGTTANGRTFPVPAGFNYSLQAQDTKVTIEQVLTAGDIFIGPCLTPPGGDQVEVIACKTINTSSVFQGTATIKLLVAANNAKMYRKSGGAFTNLTCFVDQANNETTCTTPGTSDFVLMRNSDGSALPDEDTEPPVTALNIVGDAFVGATELYASTRSKLHLLASDAFAGVETTFYRVDPTTDVVAAGLSSSTVSDFLTYMGPLSQGEGRHLLAFASRDHASNYEILVSTFLIIDGTPPETALSFGFDPESSTTTLGGAPIAQITELTPLRFAVRDPPIVGTPDPPSGVSASFLLIDATPEACGFPTGTRPVVTLPASPNGTCGNPEAPETFTLSPGTHTVAFFSVDNVNNIETVRYQEFDVDFVDQTPPETSLSAQGEGAFFSEDGAFYLNAAMHVVLNAVDFGSPTISGVEASFYAVEPSTSLIAAGLSGATSAQFVLFSAPFSLSEGSHTLAFASRDFAANYEILKTSPVYADGTPPVAAHSVTGSSSLLAGVLRVQEEALFTLSAIDPEINGAASGVDVIEYLIDVDPESCEEEEYEGEPTGPAGSCGNREYQAPFSLSAGTHTLYFGAIDRVENESPIQSVSLLVVAPDDDSPTVSSLFPANASFISSPRPLLSAAFTDFGSGIATATIRLELDNQQVAADIQHSAFTGAGPWTSVTPLPEPRTSHEMLSYGNFIYAIGGNTTSGVRQPSVFRNIVQPNGSLGAWTNEATLPAGVQNFGAAVANGMFYVIGGQEGGSEGTTTTRYTQVNADGSLDPWQIGPNIPSPEFGLDAVGITVAGAYLYAIGGTDNTSSIPVDNVFVSALAPNGTPGPWAATTPLPEPLLNTRVVEQGGRIYVLGGQQTAGFIAVARVYMGQTQADGTISSWTRLQDMPAPRASGAALIQNGTILYAGGWLAQAGAPAESTVFTAKATLTGLEDWTIAADALPQGLLNHSGAAVGGHFIITGGHGDLGGAFSVAYKSSLGLAEAVPTSSTATFTPGADLAQGQHSLKASAEDQAGNIGMAESNFTVDSVPPILALSIDGISQPSATIVRNARPELVLSITDATSGLDPPTLSLVLDGAQRIQDAAVSAEEVRFTPADDLAQGPHSLTALARDKAGNLSQISVQFAIDSSTPQIVLSTPTDGAYFATTTIYLAAAFADPESGVSTTTIRLQIDGQDLSPVIESQQASAGSGQWESAADLPKVLLYHRMVAFGRHLYAIGGGDNVGPSNKVYMNAVNPDGSLGTWTAQPDLPAPAQRFGAAMADGVIYVLGGTTGGAADNAVFYTRANPDGSLEPWQTGPALPTGEFGLDAVGITVAGAYLYALGGSEDANSATPTDKVFLSALGVDGRPGPWSASSPLPEPLLELRAVEHSGTVVLLGGMEPGFIRSPRVYAGSPGPGGHITNWTRQADLPGPRSDGAAMIDDGLVIYAGGHSGGDLQATVFTARLTGGTLTSWDTADNLPEALMFHAGVAAAGHVFVSGGSSPGVSFKTTVLRASYRETAASASATASSFNLAEGSHTATALANDNAGNLGSASAVFNIDLTPPVSAVEALASSRIISGALHVQAGTELILSADDPLIAGAASGLGESFLGVDGGTPEISSAAFILQPGAHTLVFFSRDAVGNEEAPKTLSVFVDGQAPAAVLNLALVAGSSHSLSVSWAAPGDDGASGTISEAQTRIFYANDQQISASTMMAQVVINHQDLVPATALNTTIASLADSTTYYLTLFTRDTAGNWSAPSNILAARTFNVASSSDNAVTVASEEDSLTVTIVSTETATEAFTVATASQGITPALPDFYELTDGLIFTQPAILSFFFNPQLIDPLSISIFTYDQGLWSSASIVNQQITLLAADLAYISGEIFHTSLYAPMVIDNAPPLTAFEVLGASAAHPQSGHVFLAAAAQINLTAQDQAPLGGSPVGVLATRYKLDNGSEAAFTAPFSAAEGAHAITFHSTDRSGTIEPEKSQAFFVDATAPQTSASADQATIPTATGFFIASATATLTLSSLDPEINLARSGLALVEYSLNGNAIAAVFTAGDAQDSPRQVLLASGQHEVKLKAVDLVGNATERTIRYVVGAFDSSPLLSYLLSSCKDIDASGQSVLTGDARSIEKIKLKGQAVLNGDALAQQTTLSGQAQITGTMSQGSFNCRPIDLAQSLGFIQSANDNADIPQNYIQNGKLILSGQQSLTLPSGRYLLAGIDISGQASLQISGKVDLFVQGPIEISGNGKFNPAAPKDLVVFSNSNLETKISGQAEVGAILYAPESKLKASGQAKLAGHFAAADMEASGQAKLSVPAEAAGAMMAMAVVPESGGAVEAPQAAVFVPTGALDNQTTITISSEDKTDFAQLAKKEEAAQEQNLTPVSEPIEYGPEGTVFDKPVTLSIAYDASNLPSGISEDDLKISYWNPQSQLWEPMPSTVDKANKKVLAKTTHFSLYQVMGSGSGGSGFGASAAADFSLGEVYVFPNPAVGGAKPTFHAEVGTADEVKIRVYDLSGRSIFETTLTGLPQNLGGAAAYEYAWDAHIPSGVYFYSIEASRSGFGKLKKVGKFAVIR